MLIFVYFYTQLQAITFFYYAHVSLQKLFVEGIVSANNVDCRLASPVRIVLMREIINRTR